MSSISFMPSRRSLFWHSLCPVVIMMTAGSLPTIIPLALIVVRDRCRAAGKEMSSSIRGHSRFWAVCGPTLIAGFLVWPRNDAASLLGNTAVVAVSALSLLLLFPIASRQRDKAQWWTPPGAARQAYAAAVGLHRRTLSIELEAMERVFAEQGRGKSRPATRESPASSGGGSVGR